MANPTITSVSPAAGSSDIVLGQSIVIQFDQLINTDTVNNATLALIGSNLASVVTPDQIIDPNPAPVTGTGYVLGTFAFASINGNTQTQVTFTPAAPLRPGSTYKVLVVGKDSPSASVLGSYVKNTTGEPMLVSYQWSFTTGTLNLVSPPTQNPISISTSLYPNRIQINPRNAVGNDISEIELIFPAPIDPNTFEIEDVLVGVQAILNDPDVFVNPGIAASAVVQGNKIIVFVDGL